MNKAVISALDQKSDIGSLCFNVEEATSPFPIISSKNSSKKRKKIDEKVAVVSSHQEFKLPIPEYLPFEIPRGTKAGKKLTVQWPGQNGSRFVIACPENIDQSCSRQVLVVAPQKDRPSFSFPKPVKTISKKRTWSRIGSDYQADILPMWTGCMNGENESSTAQYDQIWNPYRVKNSMIDQRSNVDEFMNSLKHSFKEFGMVSLHQNNYSVTKTIQSVEHETINNTNRRPWTESMRQIFHNTILEELMNMPLISSKVGRSVSECLVYYYGDFRRTDDFIKFLRKANEIFECCVACGKGGKLICCDGCNIPYHLKCVKPPLVQVPKGSWFCSRCIECPHRRKLLKIILS